MKKITMFVLITTITASVSSTIFAAEIPRESAPENVTEESIIITENLIGGILDEVQNGLGYGEAWGKASREVHSAVLAGNTNGYAYADLAAISRNAIMQYRDMYLRPEYYAERENTVKALIADLIAEVQNGTKDYAAARNEAYTRIYQMFNPSYTPNIAIGVDRIYLDIPAADSVMFTQARKLLKEAEGALLYDKD